MVTNDLEATYEDFVPYQDSLATNQTVIDATRINYLRPTIQTQTVNGVALTNNGDGTYTLNGTATDHAHFYLKSPIDINNATSVRLTGNFKNSNCRLFIINNS